MEQVSGLRSRKARHGRELRSNFVVSPGLTLHQVNVFVLICETSDGEEAKYLSDHGLAGLTNISWSTHVCSTAGECCTSRHIMTHHDKWCFFASELDECRRAPSCLSCLRHTPRLTGCC